MPEIDGYVVTLYKKVEICKQLLKEMCLEKVRSPTIYGFVKSRLHVQNYREAKSNVYCFDLI